MLLFLYAIVGFCAGFLWGERAVLIGLIVLCVLLIAGH